MNTLLILGILIIVGMFAVSTYYAQQIQQIKVAGVVCNSPIGGIGSLFSQDFARECSVLSTANTVMSFSPIGYGIGVLLIVISIVTDVISKITGASSQKPTHKRMDDEEMEHVVKSKSKSSKFCPSCGNKLLTNSKFCGKCGEKT